MRLCRPLARYLLLKRSAHHHAGRAGWFTLAIQGVKMLKGKPSRVKV